MQATNAIDSCDVTDARVCSSSALCEGLPKKRAERQSGVQDRSQVPSAESCTLPPLLAGFGRSPQVSARPQSDPLRPPQPYTPHA